MNSAYKLLVDHFRCPESLFTAGKGDAHPQACSGSRDHASDSGALERANDSKIVLSEILRKSEIDSRGLSAPTEFGHAIQRLRLEEYPLAAEAKAALSQPQVIRWAYYALRPLLPVAFRKWAQKAYFTGWQNLPFPRWPVDFTVEEIFEQLLLQYMKSQRIDALPFLWFWPHGKKSCLIITHDVESQSGRDFTSALMDLDDRYGVKSSFQIIPEQRYTVSPAYLSELRARGFEVNVHDLTHDGRLFRSHRDFLRHARVINRYATEWEAAGFRSGALYRRQEWFDALDFEYDMSVPNVACLEPQRGGCCTVFPYFIGDLLEIPITAAQDYSLFHILNDYSIELWRKQIELICQTHGLISFIVHPDYIRADSARQVYERLLAHIKEIRQPEELWVTSPGEVNRWWRMRQLSALVRNGSSWMIVGPAKRHARLAYARLADEKIVFEVVSPGVGGDSTPVDRWVEAIR